MFQITHRFFSDDGMRRTESVAGSGYKTRASAMGVAGRLAKAHAARSGFGARAEKTGFSWVVKHPGSKDGFMPALWNIFEVVPVKPF